MQSNNAPLGAKSHPQLAPLAANRCFEGEEDRAGLETVRSICITTMTGIVVKCIIRQ